MIYDILKVIFTMAFRLFFRAKSYGEENIPPKGGIIMAANHMSNADPPFMACFMPRKISYMAKEELFTNPVFGWAIRQCHAFPVKRGASDKAAIKTALSVLKDGRALGMFPEGKRSKTGEIGKAKAGVAMIAAMANVPILPVAILGTHSILNGEIFPKLKIMYGKPMIFAGNRKNSEEIEAFSAKIMTEIARMKAELENLS